MSERQTQTRGGGCRRIQSLATVLMLATAALAAPKEPEEMTALDELRRELSSQASAVRTTWQQGKELAASLAAARDALKQQRSAVEPGRTRLRALNRKIGAIDGYTAWHQLPGDLQKLIKVFENRKQALQSDLDLLNAVTPKEAPNRRRKQLERSIQAFQVAVQRYKQLRQQIQQALPRLARPSFVPQGETLPRHRAKLVTQRTQLIARNKPGEDELTRRGQALRGAITGAARHDDRVAAAERRYYQLLYVLHTRFLPAHVTEVKLTAPLDPRADQRVYYHATIDEPEQLRQIDAKIAALVEQLPTVHRRVDQAHRVWVNSERKFTAVTDRWLEKNETYEWVLYKEYTLQAAAEVADVFIGLASEGFAPPAVLFELAWRTGEAGLGDFRVAEPKLDEALLKYRQRLARELTPTPDNPVPPTADDAQVLRAAERRLRESRKYETLAVTAEDIIANQKGELTKGAISNTFGLLAEGLAEAALKHGRKLDGNKLLHAMTIAALHPGVNFDTFLQFTATSKSKIFRDLDRVIAGGVADRADTLVKKLKEPGRYGDMAKGFALAATVTVAKDAIKNGIGYTDQRARLMADMAVLDIEWFARRAEYHAAGHFHRQCLQMLAGYKAKIGQLYQQRAAIAARPKRVIANRPFATIDKVLGAIRFNRPVRDVRLKVGRASPSVKLARNGTYATFEMVGIAREAGEVRIEIAATRKDVTGVPLDANAETVARYSGPTLARPEAGASLWEGLETGSDGSHRFRAEVATIELADADAARGYIPGDHVGVKWKLPGSLPYQRLRLTAIPMAKPVELGVPRLAEGSMQFRLPEKAGTFRLVIVGGPKGKYEEYFQVAETRVTAGLTVLRSLPGGRFTKVSQYALPSRGRWFNPSKRDIESGKGRLLLERRDAARQLWSLHTVIRPAGSKKPVYSGYATEVDLPPGSYDVTFGATVPMVLRGVSVIAGRSTRVKTTPVGRLEFRTDDALGKKASPHRTVYRTADNARVYSGYATAIELPPGNYKIVFSYTVAIEQESVAVAAGRASHVHTGGYGRFDLQKRDALGKAASPHLRVLRESDDVVVYSGYANTLDLPPGSYKVVYGYIVPMEFTGRKLAAGRVTAVQSGALGRIRIRAVSARGAKVNPHRRVYRAGSDKPVYSGYATSLDLPPGGYVLKFKSGDEDRSIGVQVRAGAQSPVTITVR